MIIVSGASNNHYYSLIQLIDSFINKKVNGKLILYNLGIDDDKWNILKNKYQNYNFFYKIFDYSKYPSWFNININAGEYAWKPVIIYNTYIENKDEIIIWMDSGNIITDDLATLKNSLDCNYLHSGDTDGDIEKWTHPTTIKYLNCNNLKNRNKNGACMGFNTKQAWVKEFIEYFYKCACDKECIAPESSSRLNHRQDQAVFTILYYKYLDKFKFKNYSNSHWKIFLGYTIHNDLD